MSRFVNLEFNHESGESHERRIDKNEAYYAAEAQTAFEQARFEQALRAYARMLEVNPASAPAWTGQVRALIELGEYREARLWADKALEKFPHEPELLAAKAVALGRSGDLAGAIAFSDASIEEHGHTPFVWLARGDVMLARAEKLADYCFDKALALAPRNWFFHWCAARIRHFYQQFAQALKLVQQALEWDPGQGVLWLLAASCQHQLGLAGAAQTSLAQARQLCPNHNEVNRVALELARGGARVRLRGFWRRLFSP